MSGTSIVRRAGQAARGAIGMPPRHAIGHDSPRGTESAFASAVSDEDLVDLTRRRDQLNARVAELQWDLGGLVYEMAIRDRIRVEVLVRRAAELQNADAELNEVERILRLEQTATAGQCASCGAPHSTGAAYCWQCGQPLLREVHHDAIGAP
jgi:chorismate mutase